ncbi:DNA polymerase eta isoform X2 [Nematostella vectensis]|nr:DNA polymerase eta isoform X2 [Nematostella vectensis]XP_048580275.1 DNA polymerase eta isoform X2 [Nematostella vectensis]
MTVPEIAEEVWRTTAIEGLSSKGSDTTISDELQKEWLSQLEASPYLRNLAAGAVIAAEMRHAVLEKTGFTCSAGVATNKVLAKLCCGLNKPDKQTLLPHSAVTNLFKTMPLRKVRHLGGKLGSQLHSELNVEFMGDLLQFKINDLKAQFGSKNGELLYNLCRGIDNEPVRARQLPKSVSCGKNFPGKTKLSTCQQVKFWMEQLVEELHERLIREVEVNDRQGTLLTVGLRTEDAPARSRQCPLQSPDKSWLNKRIYEVLLSFKTNKEDSDKWEPAITNLYLGGSKFVEAPSASSTPAIRTFFSPAVSAKETFESDNSGQYPGNIEPRQSLVNSEITASEAAQSECKVSPVRGSMDAFVTKMSGPSDPCKNTNDSSRLDCEPMPATKSSLSPLKSRTGIWRYMRLPNLENEQNQGDKYRASEEVRTIAQSKPLCDSGKYNCSDSETLKTSENSDRGEVGTFSGSVATAFQHSDSDYMQCDTCKEMVSAWDLPEHLDFHFAEQLQRGDNISQHASPPRKKQKTAALNIKTFFDS